MNQPQLFDEPIVYQGYVLDVTASTDKILADLFPNIDRPCEYRLADSWLLAKPRSRWPHNRRAFLLNWMRKCTNREKRSDLEARDIAVAINAGSAGR